MVIEKFKFALFTIVVLALVGIFGYWAVASIQSGTEHATEEKIKQLEVENEDLKKEVSKLTSDFNTVQARLAKFEEPEPTVVSTEPTSSKYQSLIDDLQKLVDGNVFLKEKSRGPSVGTVQNFLNIYNDTSNKVDNDYGPGTVKAVTAAQKSLGLTADGEAGSSTFKKMIDWLKKQ